MTKIIRSGVAGIALMAAMGMSSAAHADTAIADATAEVLQPLNLELDNGALDFGSIVVDGADTLTLTPDNTMDCADKNVVCVGTTSVPVFSLSGTANKDITILLPTTDVNLVVEGGSSAVARQVLTLNNFTTSTQVNNAPGVTLDGAGEATFSVGGTLNIGADQEPGIYEGSFTVEVEYQ
ncbi:MAG: DUF4402 domain-containing protein [Erythrobacter sp.]|jgi:hypothetical protein|nr:DUF4402 domain-containing protein [Erythrobacter sp.]